MEDTKHLITGIIIAICIVLFGTVGYILIEGWEFLDSLYMTIITISTVGFSEVHHISKAGRLFTIVLVFFGVGFTLYIAAAVVQFMVEGRIRIILGRRRLEKKIDRMKNHYIVCGYGRIGRVLCKNLKRKPLDLVVVEKNPELTSVMDADGVLYISGDAADEENLIRAGIKRAKGLVAVLASDADNVFLVLTASNVRLGSCM